MIPGITNNKDHKKVKIVCKIYKTKTGTKYLREKIENIPRTGLKSLFLVRNQSSVVYAIPVVIKAAIKLLNNWPPLLAAPLPVVSVSEVSPPEKAPLWTKNASNTAKSAIMIPTAKEPRIGIIFNKIAFPS